MIMKKFEELERVRAQLPTVLPREGEKQEVGAEEKELEKEEKEDKDEKEEKKESEEKSPTKTSTSSPAPLTEEQLELLFQRTSSFVLNEGVGDWLEFDASPDEDYDLAGKYETTPSLLPFPASPLPLLTPFSEEADLSMDSASEGLEYIDDFRATFSFGRSQAKKARKGMAPLLDLAHGEGQENKAVATAISMSWKPKRSETLS